MNDDTLATWREIIGWEMERQGESFDDVVACTLSEDELDVKFWDEHGPVEGQPFTLWTEKRVYFPTQYDGREKCASAPRNPCDEKMKHVP